MTLQSPKLDDRAFQDLLQSAVERIRRTRPEWDDSAHNPGMVLLEAFAHLTEVLLYRLNRVPDKVYVELLRLLGVQIQPPTAAIATLVFRVPQPTTKAIDLPRGTLVGSAGATGGQPAPTFTALQTARIEVGQTAVEVEATHATWIEAESIGVSNGRAGQVFRVQQPPMVAASTASLAPVVMVEMGPDEEDDPHAPAIAVGTRRFRPWREVSTFANVDPGDAHVYKLDRNEGTVTFAPEVTLRDEPRMRALAQVPPEGRRILASYWRGGGIDGNLPAGRLTVMKSGIKVAVEQPHAATGGRDAETLENALRRGPLELFTLDRAITEQDFEMLARLEGGVARARAFTSAELWAHAKPGSVQVVLVPAIAGNPERVTFQDLDRARSDDVLSRVRVLLDARRPLGTRVDVTWAHFKQVSVHAHVVARREVRETEVRERILARLYRTISPLPGPSGTGWGFGEPLLASHVYDAVLAEPSVRYTEQIRFVVDDVPGEAVTVIEADAHQSRTFYAASLKRLFRTQNDGASWELVHRDPEVKSIEVVRAFPDAQFPGRVAVASLLAEEGTGKARTQVLLSEDTGETWRLRHVLEGEPRDMAWAVIEGGPSLFVATTRGLFELGSDEAAPRQRLVVASDETLGIRSVATARSEAGQLFVAVSGDEFPGLYVSSDGGRKFDPVKVAPTGNDVFVRVVRYRRIGLRLFLCAGSSVTGGQDLGKGVFIAEVEGGRAPSFTTRPKWDGGTCYSLAFAGDAMFAGTNRSGVARLGSLTTDANEPWVPSKPSSSNLPTLDTQQRVFVPVPAIACKVDAERGLSLLAGGDRGVFASKEGDVWAEASMSVFQEGIDLPRTWLLCSGEHSVTVTTDDTRLRGLHREP